MDEHHSWDWVRHQYPVTAEAEPRIKAGESVSVFVGHISGEFPDGIEFPEGSDVEILER
jgi:hypothetical protein